jgi:hypothetical protein
MTYKTSKDLEREKKREDRRKKGAEKKKARDEKKAARKNKKSVYAKETEYYEASEPKESYEAPKKSYKEAEEAIYTSISQPTGKSNPTNEYQPTNIYYSTPTPTAEYPESVETANAFVSMEYTEAVKTTAAAKSSETEYPVADEKSLFICCVGLRNHHIFSFHQQIISRMRSILLTAFVIFVYSAPSDPEMICNAEKECYPKVFKPSSEFQKVHHDQSIPKGLHVRIDVQTGEKEAKLSVDHSSDNALDIVPGEEAVIVEPPVSRKSSLSGREKDAFGDFIKDLDVTKPASFVLPVLEKLEDMVRVSFVLRDRCITSITLCYSWKRKEESP